MGDPRRGNYVPDCDLANRALNGECGAMGIRISAGSRHHRYADDALLGYGARGYNWDFDRSAARASPGRVDDAGYYRNWFGNHLVTDNVLVTPATSAPSA